jgi:uncharacterized protein
MAIFGYIASILIGISLGLIGGGGSVLTIPLLVYLIGIDPVTATAYSLFIVGTSSLIGAFPKYKQGLINIKTTIVFGIPSVAAIYLTRKFIIPAIPKEVFQVGDFTVTKSLLIMFCFALLMVAASFSMIFNRKNINSANNIGEQKFNYPMIIMQGFGIGVLTGFVGAGGGFLIIPVLVMYCSLPIKMAVGTSLLIIATNSIIGFMSDILNHTVYLNWLLLLTVTALSVFGIFIGNVLSNKIDGNKLKKGFGWFVLMMGIYIIINELLLK